jgi:hypothetical protein
MKSITGAPNQNGKCLTLRLTGRTGRIAHEQQNALYAHAKLKSIDNCPSAPLHFFR